MKKEYYRYCIVNKEKYPVTSLIRLVLNSKKEVIVDLSYSLKGRGYYFKKDRLTLEKVVNKKLLNKVFKRPIEQSIYDQIYQKVSEVIDDGEKE
ncbi:MAG: YlxR family protein [Bacilli bacterium]